MHVRRQHCIYNMIQSYDTYTQCASEYISATHNSYIWLSIMKCSLNDNNGTDVFDNAFGELMRKTYPDNPDKRSTDLPDTAMYERIRKINRQLVSQ